MTARTFTFPVQSASTLPTWVPAAGSVATLTSATNGGLANTFQSQCAPYYESFFFRYVRNGDSSGVLNPYWGTYGAMIWFGDGHASGNDNSVVAMEFRQSDIIFKRLTNPSPIYGTGTDATTKWNNANNSSGATTPPVGYRTLPWGEYAVDGQPCSAHTYGALDIIPPTSGGAAHGSLITVIRVAQAQQGEFNTIAAHKVDFPNATGAPGAYAWQRVGNSPIGNALVDQPIPPWTAFVPAQNRVYYEARWAGNGQAKTPRWFNLSSQQYETGTGTPRVNNAASPYTGVMHHVPERNILIHAQQESGNLVIRWLPVSASDTNPSWAGAVTLSQTLPVNWGFSACCWCPDNSRLLVFGVVGDTTAVYEIEIPATLTGNPTWTVTRAPFPAGQSMTEPNTSGNAPGSTTMKAWSYNPKTKSVVWFPAAVTNGVDTVYVYRPRNT